MRACARYPCLCGAATLLNTGSNHTSSNAAAQTFLKIFTNVETRKMQASVREDLQTITDFMRDKLGGFDTVDQNVASGLRTCLGKTAFDLAKSFKPSGTADHVRF